MAKARAWLRKNTRGSQRSGVLVSKTAARFKPLAVDVLGQGDENAVHWFLMDKTDIRSSNYLEDAATEIQVQGLELDYTCVLWDADLRCENGSWRYFNFNGRTAWREESGQTESSLERRKYMLNAYRVLLNAPVSAWSFAFQKAIPTRPSMDSQRMQPDFLIFITAPTNTSSQ